MKTLLLKLAFAAVLLSSCKAKQTVIPDPTVAHRVAESATVTVWLRRGATKEFQAVEVEIPAGWWIVPADWASESP